MFAIHLDFSATWRLTIILCVNQFLLLIAAGTTFVSLRHGIRLLQGHGAGKVARFEGNSDEVRGAMSSKRSGRRR
jgi:hypothetical protein